MKTIEEKLREIGDKKFREGQIDFLEREIAYLQELLEMIRDGYEYGKESMEDYRNRSNFRRE